MFERSRPYPSGPEGQIAYVVGDVHGRLDLLEELLERIDRDIEAHPEAKVSLVFLGDLIDRGPNSCDVVERLRTYRHSRARTVFLLGNHEEVLLRIVGGESQLIPSWLRFGGDKTFESYGGNPQDLVLRDAGTAIASVRRAIPQSHVEFLRSFADTCRFGDYLLVHAGIRPGIDLDQQRQSDLRWIREPFLLDDRDHGFVVVHGHTISRKIDEQANRIGIDTGAFATGILTALAIEGENRRFIDTREPAAATAVPASH
jgi:serine/threonine protein phosphatase 1